MTDREVIDAKFTVIRRARTAVETAKRRTWWIVAGVGLLAVLAVSRLEPTDAPPAGSRPPDAPASR